AFCSHYLPLGILAKMKGNSPAFNPFTVCIVTDFEAHALWMDASVDLYCVAARETKGGLVARGVPADKVAVTGIPVWQNFSREIDSQSVHRRLGLREDLRILLVLGGG